MKIFVVGAGKLANAIFNAQLTFPLCEVLPWETNFLTLSERTVLVHAGSDRQLKECLEFCSRTKSVFVELSTGLGTEKLVPDFPVVVCPNTSILVLKTLKMLQAYGKYFENFDIEITESHQTTKKSEPGTAFAFAGALEFPTDKIQSVRDPLVQQDQLQVPAEYLNKHAYHQIVIRDGDDTVSIETRVLGHQSYAKGVKKIVEAILNHNLDNRLYTVFDLIDKGWV